MVESGTTSSGFFFVHVQTESKGIVFAECGHMQLKALIYFTKVDTSTGF